MKIRYIMLIVALACAFSAYSQRTYRHYLRGGDKHYTDSAYTDAIVDYKKALELNSGDFDARYNLLKAQHLNLMQSRAEESRNPTTSEQDSIYKGKRSIIAGEYANLATKTDDKKVKSEIYHNIGTMYHNDGDYAEAVKEYKRALRNNPSAEDTRYNLALALEQMRNEQPPQGGGNDEKEQEDKKDEQQEQQNQQNQQQEQQEQQQQDQQQMQNKIERIMNIANQNEKDAQEKVQKVIQSGVVLEKDW